MFKSQNFCHVASNNRNNVKAGVFVYRTTDDLNTVLTSGYFNDALIDLKLHDLIIHEQIDIADATHVEYHILCVTERTLDNVGTTSLTQEAGGDFVKLDGSSVMSGPLKFSAGSMRGAIAGGFNGLTFFKIDSQGNLAQIASLSDSQFVPASDNTLDIGTNVRKIERIYLGKVNNGYDINVPVTATTDTLALKSQVDDAANSGEQLYTTGVWYAKMYAATVVPTGAEYDGRNYADFSQVDSDNNPIIVIYTGASGVWTETTRITPPANHNGYITVTSKIWDIAEQSGQQGGEVLWSHTQKTFTPYPMIVSFNSINVTGQSSVVMPANPTGSQIVNKDYVDAVKGYHPELLSFEWDDHIRDDVQWLRADTFSWQSGAVYEAAYNELFNDIYISTSWYSAGYANVYTKSPTPAAGDTVYSDSACTTSVGTVTSYDELNNSIVYNGTTYTYNSNTYVTPTSETVAGYTVSVYTGHSGRKIVGAGDETKVANIYSATGVAWYYIIDIPNKRFKLPRINSDRKNIILEAPTVGATPASLVAGTSSATNLVGKDLALLYAFADGIAYTHMNDANDSSNAQGQPTEIALVTDFTNSTSYYAGEQYLYFYVGSFTQSAIENTAGLNASLFNGKADTDLGNVSAGVDFVVESQMPTADNNYTWYRKYKSGWVEQGGPQSTVNTTINLPVEMADTNYIVNCGITIANYGQQSVAKYTTYFSTSSVMTNVGTLGGWEVKGMAA